MLPNWKQEQSEAMVQDDDVSRIVQVLRHSPAHSALYQWMRKHHGRLLQELGETRPSWNALATEFSAMGLKDGRGETLTAERTRKVWWQVRHDVAKSETRRTVRQAVAAPSPVSVAPSPVPLEPAAVRVAPTPLPVAAAAGRDPVPAFDPSEGADEPIAPQRFGVSKIPQ